MILRGHTDDVQGLAFSPDGRRLASISLDRTVKIWDPAANQEALTFRFDGELLRLDFTADGEGIALTTEDKKIRILDAVTGKETALREARGEPVKGFFYDVEPPGISAGGNRLVDNKSVIRDVTGGQEIRLEDPRPNRMPFRYAFSPDGSRVVEANEIDVTIYDAASGKRLVRFSPGMRGYQVSKATRATRWVLQAAFSPDAKRLVIGGARGDLKLWDVQTGQEILTLRGHKGPILGLAFSADGSRLASASRDGTIKVWDSMRYAQALTGNN